MKTQAQMLHEAEQKTFRLNSAFMELVNHPTNPMTAADLRALVARRPAVYGRFAGFIATLEREESTFAAYRAAVQAESGQ